LTNTQFKSARHTAELLLVPGERRGYERSWGRHLLKTGILQYFNPTGLCQEEAEKFVTRPTVSGGEVQQGEDDVDGYNVVFVFD